MATVAQDFDELRRRRGDAPVIEAVVGARALAGDAEPRIVATPYRCRDPRSMPARRWVYGRQLLRGSLSVIVAPGASGKTTLLVGTALALVTGRPLHDRAVWDGPQRVWLWNLEDSEEEIARLIEAARLHWNITDEDVGGRLFLSSGLDGAELCVAVEDREGFRILDPVIDELVTELKAKRIDVLVIDPFVSSHSVSENNNGAMDAVAKKWARVGVLADCSIVLVHHTRKLNGAEASAEGMRGASAVSNASRSVVAINKMTPEEAARFGIQGEERRRFVKTYDDKNNRAPPADKADWFQIVGVDLGNGPLGGHGDNMPVALPWSPPDAFDGLTVEHLLQVQAKVAGGSWRKDPQSPDWVGEAVADVLGLDVSERKGPDAARTKALLAKWVANGMLTEEDGMDEKRRVRRFVRVGRSALEEDATR